jgi:hypothetical protein
MGNGEWGMRNAEWGFYFNYQLPIPHSAFRIPHSPFPIPHSPFRIPINMAIHKKRDISSPAAARLLLESTEPVELPPAEIDEAGVSIERDEFEQYLSDLLDVLRRGVTAEPAPIVQSDSLFVINGASRSFWVRLWHTDSSRTHISRLHVLSCLPLTPKLKINLGNL